MAQSRGLDDLLAGNGGSRPCPTGQLRPSCTGLHSCFKEQSSQGKTTSLLAILVVYRVGDLEVGPGLAREVMQHLKTCAYGTAAVIVKSLALANTGGI